MSRNDEFEKEEEEGLTVLRSDLEAVEKERVEAVN